MSHSLGIPYLLQLKEAVNAVHLMDNVNNITLGIPDMESSNITLVPSYETGTKEVIVKPIPQTETVEDNLNTETNKSQKVNSNGQISFIYEVVYPEQLNLKPVYNLKRGRPKRKKVKAKEVPVEAPKVVKPAPRTRSGRLIKFPKHIIKDFKKVEIEDTLLEGVEPELKTSEFVTFEEEVKGDNTTKEVQLQYHQSRRKISAQYRCPKCTKVYLGKTKMMQHIKKYPDHGPLPQTDLNFEVWNYLVDITQKCPPAQRGIKFCEELTNLLHNVLLLTSALFKKVEINKNHVEVDKVLGNAIGLPPGLYKFNDSELYKDVTVLKLISNSDFFKPLNSHENLPIEKKIEQVNNKFEVLSEKSGLEKASEVISPKKGDLNGSENIDDVTKAKKAKSDLKMNFNVLYKNEEASTGKFLRSKLENEKVEDVDSLQCQQNSKLHDGPLNCEKHKKKKFPDTVTKKSHEPPLEDGISVHTDLLSENSLLNMPILRNSVDELILSSVDTSTHLLDNSTSSDELMNVDQFVNERFKKITEPDIDIGGGGLNLDLPSLDLFQFNSN